MIYALCLFFAFLVFLALVTFLVYAQIVRPMREQIASLKAEQHATKTTIAKNERAALGLYGLQSREFDGLSRRLSIVEGYALPVMPEAEKAPITVRSAR